MMKIHPLHVGTITRPMSGFGYGFESKVIDVPLICWYIEGSDKNILVDTGGGDPARAPARAAPYERKKEQSLENALKRIGVECGEIDLVVVTHLHWDHCGENDLFPKAKIFIQRQELESAKSPFPITAGGYIRKMVEEIDYTAISGDRRIAEGVKIISMPGHTYGFQGVLVESENRRMFIAGDAISFFKNLDQDPPLISGFYVDLKSYYRSLQKMAELNADLILPGHDFRVFEQQAYY
jgi:glyoxylase-like metal-dependent hydrolase (beta-lactamase superfamily II)